MTKHLKGRLTALLTLFALAGGAWADAPAQLHIGYQKASTSQVLAKEHRLLEQRFAHTRIDWVEFPAGPQMLEALNVGAIDLGGSGDIPPIFAQAAGADLLYVGTEPAKPQAETIIVPRDSPIHDLAGLKGRRVAFQKGSSSHNTLLRALQKAGLGIGDIQPLYLTPADARAAFESGQVDAWAIWDPWYSQLELEGRARLLANGEGLDLSGPFYLASRAFAERNGEFLRQVLDTFTQAEALTRSDKAGSVAIMARVTGLSPQVIELTFSHRPPASPIRPLNDADVAAQQRTADLFYANRILPRAVSIAPAVWRPGP